MTSAARLSAGWLLDLQHAMEPKDSIGDSSSMLHGESRGSGLKLDLRPLRHSIRLQVSNAPFRDRTRIGYRELMKGRRREINCEEEEEGQRESRANLQDLTQLRDASMEMLVCTKSQTHSRL